MLKEKNKMNNVILSETKNLIRSFTCVQDDNQRGRSMVEMLGVLAIVGVLSVTGVSGYTSAMNKHRANELLNEASKRATVVAAQAMQGRETFSINEFPNNDALKFNTEVTHDKTNTQFTLEITGVSEAVCQQMQKNIGVLVRKFEPKTCSGDNNTVRLTFNDDMSTTPKASDYDGDELACKADSSRRYCTSNDTCISATDTCPSTDNCPTGTTVDPNYTGTDALGDGECICTDHTTNQCGLGYYCHFYPLECGDSDRGDGKCQPVGSGTPITPAGNSEKTYLKGPETDWWSAYSWCIGNNMNLVTGSIAGHSLSSDYKNYAGNGDLYRYFGQNIYFWTGHDDNSCRAWSLIARSSHEAVHDGGRDFIDSGCSALCE